MCMEGWVHVATYEEVYVQGSIDMRFRVQGLGLRAYWGIWHS